MFEKIMRSTVTERQRQLERDWVMHHLEQAERILNGTFGGVGVAHLDDARKMLIEEEFPDE